MACEYRSRRPSFPQEELPLLCLVPYGLEVRGRYGGIRRPCHSFFVLACKIQGLFRERARKSQAHQPLWGRTYGYVRRW